MRIPQLNGSVAAAAAITAALYLPSATAWAEDVVVKGIDDGIVVLVDDVEIDSEEENASRNEVTDAVAAQQWWIGVSLQPLSDVVRSQLELSDDVGVVINRVFPDSPAAAAGVEQYDIVLGLGDQPIRDPKLMADVVAEAKGSEMKVSIIRKGSPVELTVTPAQRPGLTIYAPGIDHRVDADSTDRHPEWLLRRKGQSREFDIVRPGIVLGFRNGEQHYDRRALPEGMRLRIERESGKPDRIIIDRGDDHWELTDPEEIEELPDDVRPHVKRHLGQPLGGGGFSFDAPLQRGLRWLASRQDEEEESRDEEGDFVWHELEDGGPLPNDFSLESAMEQIEQIRKQFEQLADQQAERTEELVEEKSERLEETLNERVTRLEKILVERADQLREVIESFFGDHEEVEVEIEIDEDEQESKPAETEAEEEVEIELNIDVDTDSDAV